MGKSNFSVDKGTGRALPSDYRCIENNGLSVVIAAIAATTEFRTSQIAFASNGIEVF